MLKPYARQARNVASPNDMRKKQFRIALAHAEKTQEQVAAEFGVTGGHLSLVISGRTVSAPLLAKVDAFIARHVPA